MEQDKAQLTLAHLLALNEAINAKDRPNEYLIMSEEAMKMLREKKKKPLIGKQITGQIKTNGGK